MYRFKELLKNFERFTPEFLDNKKITPEEKAYLIGLHSQSFKSEDYAVTTYSNQEIANNLNIPLRTVQNYNKSLQEKEIMTEIATSLTDDAGFNIPAKAVDMHKIGQAILYINKRVDNHEDRITNLERMLEMALRENKNLKKENELLKVSKDGLPTASLFIKLLERVTFCLFVPRVDLLDETVETIKIVKNLTQNDLVVDVEFGRHGEDTPAFLCENFHKAFKLDVNK